jgi:hypothetical protein
VVSVFHVYISSIYLSIFDGGDGGGGDGSVVVVMVVWWW